MNELMFYKHKSFCGFSDAQIQRKIFFTDEHLVQFYKACFKEQLGCTVVQFAWIKEQFRQKKWM